MESLPTAATFKSKGRIDASVNPVLYGESSAEQQTEILLWAKDVIQRYKLEGYVYIQTHTTTIIRVEAREVTGAKMILKGTVPMRLKESYLGASNKLLDRVRDIDTNVKLQLCEGDIAPELDLYNLEGGKERLFGCARRYKRRLVVLFWSADSGASLLPLMDLEVYAREGVSCVAVSVDSSMEETRDLACALSPECEYLWCGVEGWNSKASREWGVHSTPMCFVVDDKKRVVRAGHPVLQKDEIERALHTTPGPEDDSTTEHTQTWTNLSVEKREEFVVNFQSTLRALQTTHKLHLEISALASSHACTLDTTSFVLYNTGTCSKEEHSVVDTHLQRLLAKLEQVDYTTRSD